MPIPLGRGHARGRTRQEKLTRRPGACEPCRESKTKCDGEEPCSECRNKKRKKPECVYRQRGLSRKDGVDLGSEDLYADQDNALSPTEEEESGEDEDDSTMLCEKSKFNGPFAAINCIDAFCKIVDNASLPELGLDLEDGVLTEDLPPLTNSGSTESPRRSLDSTSIFSFIEEAGDVSLLSEECHEIHAQVMRAQQYLDGGCLRKSWAEYQALLGKAQAECLDQLDWKGLRSPQPLTAEAKCRLWSRIQSLGVWLSFLSGRTLTLLHGSKCPEPNFKKLGRRRLALANGNRNLTQEISRILSLSKTEGYKIAGISVDPMDLNQWLASSEKAMKKSSQGDEKLALPAADLGLRLNFCSMVIKCFRAQSLHEPAQATDFSRPDSQPTEGKASKARKLDHSAENDIDSVQLSHKREQILITARDILNTFDFIYQRARDDLALQWIQCLAGFCAAVVVGLYTETQDESAEEDHRLFERACVTFRDLQKTSPTSQICTTASTVLTSLQSRHEATFNGLDYSAVERGYDDAVKHESTSLQTSFTSDTMLPPESGAPSMAYYSPRKRRRMSLPRTTSHSSPAEMPWSQDSCPPSNFYSTSYQPHSQGAFEHAAVLQHSAGPVQHDTYMTSGPAIQYQTANGSGVYEGNAALSYTHHGQMQASQGLEFPPYRPVFVSRHSVHPPETFHPPLDYPPLIYMPSSTSLSPDPSAILSSPYTLPLSNPLSLPGAAIQLQSTGAQNVGTDQYSTIMSSPVDHRRMSTQIGPLSSSVPPSRRSSIARTHAELPNSSACAETPRSSIFSPTGRRPHPLRTQTLEIAGGILTPQDSPAVCAVDAGTSHQEEFAREHYIQPLSETHVGYDPRYHAADVAHHSQNHLQGYQFPTAVDPSNNMYGVYSNQHNGMESGQMNFNTPVYGYQSQPQQIPVTNSFNIMNWSY